MRAAPSAPGTPTVAGEPCGGTRDAHSDGSRANHLHARGLLLGHLDLHREGLGDLVEMCDGPDAGELLLEPAHGLDDMLAVLRVELPEPALVDDQPVDRPSRAVRGE